MDMGKKVIRKAEKQSVRNAEKVTKFNAIRELTGKKVDKQLKNFSEKKIRTILFKFDFIYNERLGFIRREIDVYFNNFFDRFIRHYPQKDKLIERKERLRESFYLLVYKQLKESKYLSNYIKYVNEYYSYDLPKKSFEKIITTSITPLINDVFFIPNFLASAIGGSVANFEKQIKSLEYENKSLDEAANLGKKFKGHQLSNHTKLIYGKIFKKWDELKKKNPSNRFLRQATFLIAGKDTINYTDKQEIQKLYNKIKPYRRIHNIQSYQDFEKIINLPK